MTYPLISTHRCFLSQSGRLEVHRADGTVLGWVANDPARGPCVRFATLDPLSLILCFRVGLNRLGDPDQSNSDLLVDFSESSLLAQVRCRIWRFRPSISPWFAFSLWVDDSRIPSLVLRFTSVDLVRTF